MMDVYDFVEVADGAGFCDFSECFEVHIVGFSLVVGLVFIEVEDVVVAAGTEALGVEGHFSLASFAGRDFWLPIYFFITCITETLGMMFFFFRAVATFLYHHFQ